jgi:hypothetical protein
MKKHNNIKRGEGQDRMLWTLYDKVKEIQDFLPRKMRTSLDYYEFVTKNGLYAIHKEIDRYILSSFDSE